MTASTATANETNLKASISAGTSLQSGNSNNENYNAAHALKVFNNQYGYSHSVKAFMAKVVLRFTEIILIFRIPWTMSKGGSSFYFNIQKEIP